MARFVQAIRQLFRSNTPERFVKLVGKDRFENKFYERLPGNRHYNSSRRFYEPVNYENVRLAIDPAWEAWLRGTRKDPPTFDETIVQETKRQQLAEKPVEMLSTSYGQKSAKGGTTSFPIREKYEMNPGIQSRTKSDSNDTF